MSDETEPKQSKRQHVDERDNIEGNNLGKNEGKMEEARYILSSFLPLLLLFSNRLLDPGEKTRSLNHLICIPKICYSRNTNFALKFSGRSGLKAQKPSIPAALKKDLNLTWFPQLLQLPAPPTTVASLKSTWNSIFPPTTTKISEPNFGSTSGKVLDPI